jgi:hypothetical protein
MPSGFNDLPDTHGVSFMALHFPRCIVVLLLAGFFCPVRSAGTLADAELLLQVGEYEKAKSAFKELLFVADAAAKKLASPSSNKGSVFNTESQRSQRKLESPF